jgi:hypothetical protein
MNLRVSRLDLEGVDIVIPLGWRTRDTRGEIHPACFEVAVDWIGRLYWERALDLSPKGIEIESTSVHRLKPWAGDLTVRFGISSEDREQTILALRRDGEVDWKQELHVFNSQEQRVASLDVHWHLKEQIRIGGGGR